MQHGIAPKTYFRSVFMLNWSIGDQEKGIHTIKSSWEAIVVVIVCPPNSRTGRQSVTQSLRTTSDEGKIFRRKPRQKMLDSTTSDTARGRKNGHFVKRHSQWDPRSILKRRSPSIFSKQCGFITSLGVICNWSERFVDVHLSTRVQTLDFMGCPHSDSGSPWRSSVLCDDCEEEPRSRNPQRNCTIEGYSRNYICWKLKPPDRKSAGWWCISDECGAVWRHFHPLDRRTQSCGSLHSQEI
jgi:hypothetical protein